MDLPRCEAFRPYETHWSFCPNTSANYLFAVLFGSTMFIHIAQAIHYERRNCWVIILSASCQLGAYMIRGLSMQLPTNQSLFLAWNAHLMTAPLWTNAFVYLLVGHLASKSAFLAYLPVYRVRSWHISTCFILLDIVAFAIQSSGIIMATQPPASIQTVLRGIHIYMAGIRTQQCFVLLFSFVLYKLYRTLKRCEGSQYRTWAFTCCSCAYFCSDRFSVD
ncbi:hypothetical protein K458DRAFT_181821 [Lentithecium fluviatile CBS 122367]|uniref:RTA1-domain-containing protein n=1 Tax=Lentithecium fluviatile CBS 122367 TaxID=1168545 RepID=A0A6G1IEI8_9PLEO|nr:hypothetical protein K458DRAFT_181821 [Lentithecium fluviatile CBS 122367]